LKRQFKLLPAIAAQRPKDIAGEALRMDTNQRRLGVDVAHDESYGFFPAALAFTQEITLKTQDAELSPTGREIGLRDLPY
jgi:hypothetical protein